MLALHLLGRDEEAITLGELAADAQGPASAWQWSHGDGDLTLTELVNPADHLAELLAHIRSGVRWVSCDRTSPEMPSAP
ncbi:hypothetical protein GCM10027053_12190 [Intrasporangium mesophilum]